MRRFMACSKSSREKANAFFSALTAVLISRLQRIDAFSSRRRRHYDIDGFDLILIERMRRRNGVLLPRQVNQGAISKLGMRRIEEVLEARAHELSNKVITS